VGCAGDGLARRLGALSQGRFAAWQAAFGGGETKDPLALGEGRNRTARNHARTIQRYGGVPLRRARQGAFTASAARLAYRSRANPIKVNCLPPRYFVWVAWPTAGSSKSSLPAMR